MPARWSALVEIFENLDGGLTALTTVLEIFFLGMFDTILPADSLEFCPHPDARDIFVCGTYNLVKSDEIVRTAPQKRNGQCLVFRCEYDQDDIAQSSLCVHLVFYLIREVKVYLLAIKFKK